MINLIINADDFGMSNMFNDCILELLSKRKITSTTVMVNRISPVQNKRVLELKKLKETSDISVGLHVEFTYDKHLEQVRDQYHRFISLFNSPPSHLDIHKEHLHGKYHEIVAKFCKDYHLGFRNHGQIFDGVATTAKKYFYGSIADFNPIDIWLNDLEDEKVYEMVFHPGVYDPNCYSSLNEERRRDIQYIDKIYHNLQDYNVRLVSFNHLD